MHCSVALTIALVMLGGAMASVLPFSMSNIPEEYKELIPDEVKNFYKGLTAADRQILRELINQHATFSNEEAAMEALKARSEPLYQKVNELLNFVQAKIQGLKPAGKQFVEQMMQRARSLRPAEGQRPNMEKIKKMISDTISAYQALPEEVKEELGETFPHTTKIIHNEKFKRLISGFVQRN